jgi:hypothetical protein
MFIIMQPVNARGTSRKKVSRRKITLGEYFQTGIAHR